MKYLVIDLGLYCEQANALWKSKEDIVWYFTPWANAFPKSQEYFLGKGFEHLTKILYLFDYIEKADCIVNFDVHNNDLIHFLKKIYPNKSIYGSGLGERLENDRWGLKRILRDVGMKVQKSDKLHGVHELKDFLKTNPDKFVKLGIFRGDVESFYAKNYDSVELRLDEVEAALGPFHDEYDFIAEDNIDTDVEVGYDGFFNGVDYLKPYIIGYEYHKGLYCYDKETEVLTDKGWKLFKDLDKSELLVTLNTNDSRHYKIEYHKPENYIKYRYNGDMIHFCNNQTDLLVTPNHRMFVQVNTNGGKHRELVEAQLLKYNFKMPIPSVKFNGKDKKIEYIKIDNKFIPKGIFSQFLGLYLSEGSIRTNIKRNEIIVSQFKYVEEFKEILSKMPFVWHRVKNGFSLNNKELCNYLRQFGKSGDKFVPEFIKNSSHSIIKKFLDCYCLGDGSIRNSGSYRFYTKSKRMADDLQELLLKIGSVGIITFNGKQYHINQRIKRDVNNLFKEDIKIVKYDDYVYCVTVSNHIIYVRRNGIPMWCGNCGHVTDEMPIPIKDTMDRLKPVLQKVDWRGAISTEEKVISPIEHYFLDICSRLPAPLSSLYPEYIKNWSEVVYKIGKKEPVRLDIKYKYVGAFPLESEHAQKNYLKIDLKKEHRDKVKFRMVCQNDGKYYANKGMNSVVVLVAAGNTVDEVINKLKDAAKYVDAYGLDKDGVNGIEVVKKIISKGTKVGIPF